jgi:hypothetical protein
MGIDYSGSTKFGGDPTEIIFSNDGTGSIRRSRAREIFKHFARIGRHWGLKTGPWWAITELCDHFNVGYSIDNSRPFHIDITRTTPWPPK